MAYYLIDFENVKSRGMEGVEFLTEEDIVCIFYKAPHSFPLFPHTDGSP